MALVDTTWYCNAGDQSTTGYYAVTKRPQNTAVAAGVIRRQFTAPAVGSERLFVCIVAGTTANVTDATWVLTRGAKTTDGTGTWMECTGQAALNGDLTNTATWAQVKAATPAVLGQIIKRSNSASYQICTTAGAMSASEPSFSDTAGVTTNDTTAVWTSLGVVGNFSAGGAPHARLGNALTSTWFVAGNTIYVGDNHAEAQTSAITISPTGSQTAISKILCHNHSGSYPPASGDLMAGATVSTTAAANITIGSAASSFYFYGMTFKAGVGAGTATFILLSIPSASFTVFDNCSFQILATAATSYIQIGTTTSSTIVFNNTTVGFGHVGQVMNVQTGTFIWQNTGQVLAAGSSVPTLLVSPQSNVNSTATFEAIDLSQLTGSLFFQSGLAGIGNWLVKDCKLNASVSIAGSGTPNAPGTVIQTVRCDSGATNYKSARYAYEGAETTETTITRVGGATDGTTASSDKIVTTANAQWLRPFIAMPYAIWNEITGANVTVTVYGTINSASLPNNDEIWMEIEYLGLSSSPLGTIVTTTKASLLAANAAVASDGSTWNGGGSGAGWSPFKLVATLSSPQPGMKGFIYATVKAAKASSTFYIDPLPTLS